MKKINRVKKYSEFKDIMNLRKFVRNEYFTVYYREKTQEYGRIGILVSKKNGIAVTRVKIKRQVRSIIDNTLNLKELEKDLIVVISKAYDKENFEKARTLLESLLNSIKEK
ncbi:MAG: ribonuclease P protein component [Bacilli bacterium]|nr:ribonuclease P protein component [Bacilli bacterium]